MSRWIIPEHNAQRTMSEPVLAQAPRGQINCFCFPSEWKEETVASQHVVLIVSISGVINHRPSQPFRIR